MADLEQMIREKYKCSKCGTRQCRTKEVAMTGTGLSKIFDIQHNHFLFVSCEGCGYVEVYDPNVLYGKRGMLGSILDGLFG